MIPYNYISPKAVHIFSVDFPDVDPNVLYDIKELKQSGYTFAEKENDKISEALECFGEPLEVEIKNYNYQKIKDDHGVVGDLWLYSIANGTYAFEHDEGMIELSENAIKKEYTVIKRENKVAFKSECIVGNFSNAEVLEYLKESFVGARKADFESGKMLRLSIEQVCELEKMMPEKKLLEQYDCENGGNLFVLWDEPCWQIVNDTISITCA